MVRNTGYAMPTSICRLVSINQSINQKRIRVTKVTNVTARPLVCVSPSNVTMTNLESRMQHKRLQLRAVYKNSQCYSQTV